MDIHPAAEAFPLMDEDRLHELIEDIRLHGQRQPITLCDGRILDGRNRARACAMLQITPHTTVFDGDPWAYVWSLNGSRRDLGSDQRYLIWKHCMEQSTSWQAEQQRIHDEASAKKAAIAQEKPRIETGQYHTREPQTAQVVPFVADAHPTREAKALASKTNAGAVQRGETLVRHRPDLAEHVRTGTMPATTAYRQMQREQAQAELESRHAQEVKAIQGVYDVIVIDPPWPVAFNTRETRPNQAVLPYRPMSLDEIYALKLPMAEACHVWVWTTHRFLPAAFNCLVTWGLRYVCCFVWHKPGGMQPMDLPQFNCEFALYARTGTPRFLDTTAFPTCFTAERGAHSAKPDAFYAMVARVTAGRRLDMFNRRSIPGFDGWGQESPLGALYG